jgi:hypothetical protein
MAPNYIDLSSILCGSEERCRIFTDDGRLISYDGAHLTAEGASLAGRVLIEQSPLFRSMFAMPAARTQPE